MAEELKQEAADLEEQIEETEAAASDAQEEGNTAEWLELKNQLQTMQAELAELKAAQAAQSTASQAPEPTAPQALEPTAPQAPEPQPQPLIVETHNQNENPEGRPEAETETAEQPQQEVPIYGRASRKKVLRLKRRNP